MAGFVIATDSRRCEEVLFMVNRRRQRKSFWSNVLDDVFVYTDRAAAETRCRELVFNNPRVLTLENAVRILAQQACDPIDEEAMSDMESGWDGHKGYATLEEEI